MNSLFAFLGLFVALLATSAFAGPGVSCTAPGSCTDDASGYCYTNFTSGDSYCSCHSGKAGSDCSVSVGGVCSFNNVNDTVTDYAPLTLAASFSANILHVAIASPLVTQRNYTIIAVDDSAFQDERCTYPGLNWVREFDSCHDIFKGDMPWADNGACGWTFDNSTSNSIYSAQMVVEHHDFTSPFINRTGGAEVERITQHVIPLTVIFPKSVTVFSDITVQSPVKLLSSISRQSLSADHSAATVEVTTNVIWPYFIDNFTVLNKIGGGSVSSVSLVSQSCPNNGAASCTQKWRIAISNDASCTLNSIMSLEWTLYCQLNGTGFEPAQCAIQAGDKVTATLILNSEDFCTSISTSLPISGSLASFGDSSHNRPKTNFLVGQTLYYRASVVSPNVTLNGATINSVKLTSLAQSPDVLLYSAGSATAHGVAGSFSLDTNGNNYADFYFTLSPSFIDALGDDSSRLYTTSVVVDVDFLNTVTNKRGVMSVEFASNLQSQPVALSSSFQAEEQAASASILAAGALSLGAAAIVSLY